MSSDGCSPPTMCANRYGRRLVRPSPKPWTESTNNSITRSMMHFHFRKAVENLDFQREVIYIRRLDRDVRRQLFVTSVIADADGPVTGW